jgi:hypothetical protein
VEVKTERISNWLRKIFARLFQKRPDSLEQWQRLEFRSPVIKPERQAGRHGEAS